MPVFVILAIALAVVALGTALVAGRHLWMTVRELRNAVGTAHARLTPLADELQAESAVTATEVERLQAAATRLSESRRPRRRRA